MTDYKIENNIPNININRADIALCWHINRATVMPKPFPIFDTIGNCQAALDSIGADEILRIIKAFHQVDG